MFEYVCTHSIFACRFFLAKRSNASVNVLHCDNQTVILCHHCLKFSAECHHKLLLIKVYAFVKVLHNWSPHCCARARFIIFFGLEHFSWWFPNVPEFIFPSRCTRRPCNHLGSFLRFGPSPPHRSKFPHRNCLVLLSSSFDNIISSTKSSSLLVLASPCGLKPCDSTADKFKASIILSMFGCALVFFFFQHSWKTSADFEVQANVEFHVLSLWIWRNFIVAQMASWSLTSSSVFCFYDLLSASEFVRTRSICLALSKGTPASMFQRIRDVQEPECGLNCMCSSQEDWFACKI